MAKSQSSPGFLLLIMLLVAVGVVLVGNLRSQASIELPGPLPQAKVQGWLNTEQPPTPETLAGKWVVVDIWATWCGPCLASLPELAEFNQRWQDRGVVVVGIAEDDAMAISRIKQVIDDNPGMDWPIAYGGQQAFDNYRIAGFPTLVVHDPSGEVVFMQAGTGALAQAEQLLESAIGGN